MVYRVGGKMTYKEWEEIHKKEIDDWQSEYENKFGKYDGMSADLIPKEIFEQMLHFRPRPRPTEEEACQMCTERQFMMARELNFKSPEDIDKMLTFYHEHCGEEREKEYREWLKPFITYLSEEEFVKKYSYNKSWTEEEMREYYRCIKNRSK